MAVLVEAISVIVRKDAIERAYPSGWRDFVEYVPNETFCADDDLARVGFMNPRDVKRFIERICTHGLIHMSGGKFVDIAVVDQQRGPTQPCDWLQIFFKQNNLSGSLHRLKNCIDYPCVFLHAQELLKCSQTKNTMRQLFIRFAKFGSMNHTS